MGIVKYFVEENDSDETEKEILQFGFERIRIALIGLIAIIITGLVLRELFGTLLFIVCLMPLRQNAGGYHMKNEWVCAVCSYFFLVCSILMFKFISIDACMASVIFVACVSLVFIIAPLGNINRQLDEIEKSVYRRRTRIICVVEGILFLIFMLMSLRKWYMIVLLSVFITSVLLIIGKIQELKTEGNGE